MQRALTPDEEQILVLANQGQGHIVLVAVTVNGAERMALAFHGQNPHGQYLRVLGILPLTTDVVTDSNGIPTVSTPPGYLSSMN